MPKNYTDREPLEEEFLSSISLEGKIVCDIGAYIGKYTVGFARRSKHVYVFEPMKKSFELLNSTLSLNGCFNVTAYNFGLGERNENVTLFYPMKNAGCATVNTAIAEKYKDAKTEITVLRRFDDLNIAPDFFKIDVEGAELSVLRGAEKYLREKRPELYIELHGNGPADKFRNIYAVVNFLKNIGYHLYAVEKQTGIDKNYMDARFSHLFAY